jgi:hypothetical protein
VSTKPQKYNVCLVIPNALTLFFLPEKSKTHGDFNVFLMSCLDILLFYTCLEAKKSGYAQASKGSLSGHFQPVWSPGVFATASFMEKQAARTRHVCVC